MAGCKPPFSFYHKGVEQTRGFSAEPVKLVLSTYFLLCSSGKLAI